MFRLIAATSSELKGEVETVALKATSQNDLLLGGSGRKKTRSQEVPSQRRRDGRELLRSAVSETRKNRPVDEEPRVSQVCRTDLSSRCVEKDEATSAEADATRKEVQGARRM